LGPKADAQCRQFGCGLGCIRLRGVRFAAAPGSDFAEIEQHRILDMAGEVAMVVARLQREHHVAPAAALAFGRQPACDVAAVGERLDADAVAPPSPGSATPVTNEASSETRKRATLAISSGFAGRPVGLLAPRCWTSASMSFGRGPALSGRATKTRSIGVSTVP